MADISDVDALERDAFLAKAETLSRLTQSMGWNEYEDLLIGMRAAAMEEMSSCEQSDFRFWQGVVGTLAAVIERPKMVVETASALHKDEDEDAKRLLDVKRSLELNPGMIDDL